MRIWGLMIVVALSTMAAAVQAEEADVDVCILTEASDLYLPAIRKGAEARAEERDETLRLLSGDDVKTADQESAAIEDCVADGAEEIFVHVRTPAALADAVAEARDADVDVILASDGELDPADALSEGANADGFFSGAFLKGWAYWKPDGAKGAARVDHPFPF